MTISTSRHPLVVPLGIGEVPLNGVDYEAGGGSAGDIDPLHIEQNFVPWIMSHRNEGRANFFGGVY